MSPVRANRIDDAPSSLGCSLNSFAVLKGVGADPIVEVSFLSSDVLEKMLIQLNKRTPIHFVSIFEPLASQFRV